MKVIVIKLSHQWKSFQKWLYWCFLFCILKVQKKWLVYCDWFIIIFYNDRQSNLQYNCLKGALIMKIWSIWFLKIIKIKVLTMDQDQGVGKLSIKYISSKLWHCLNHAICLLPLGDRRITILKYDFERSRRKGKPA